MQPSLRISGINGGGSDGWEILYAARALRAAGEAVIDLSVGDHDERTPDLILDAFHRSARAGATGYAPVAGTDALKAAIASRVTERTGVATGPENILVTTGGQGALFSALSATLDPGDTALYLDPYYATYPGTIRACGGRAHALALDPGRDFRPVDATFAGAPKARALLINSPNNPTGVVYDAATMALIARAVVARDLWLISDEVYEGQVWEGRHLSPRALPGMAERTLVIGSLSKSHMMTGSRIGWLVGPQEMIAMMADLATNLTYGAPEFLQAGALTALTEGGTIEAEVAARYRRRRDRLTETLADCPDLRCLPAEGGMYLMLDVRQTGLSGRTFAERLLDRHRVAVMPGESFGAAAAGHVRLALTRPEEELTRAARLLVKLAGENR